MKYCFNATYFICFIIVSSVKDSSNIGYNIISWDFIKCMVPFQWKFNICLMCDMDFNVPMRRAKPNITHLLTSSDTLSSFRSDNGLIINIHFRWEIVDFPRWNKVNHLISCLITIYVPLTIMIYFLVHHWYRPIMLTHWGRVTHICVIESTIIGSNNGLSPGRRQAIIWTNDWILLIGTLGTKFSEILSEIHTFSCTKMRLEMWSPKWRPFCLGLYVLKSAMNIQV